MGRRRLKGYRREDGTADDKRIRLHVSRALWDSRTGSLYDPPPPSDCLVYDPSSIQAELGASHWREVLTQTNVGHSDVSSAYLVHWAAPVTYKPRPQAKPRTELDVIDGTVVHFEDVPTGYWPILEVPPDGYDVETRREAVREHQRAAGRTGGHKGGRPRKSDSATDEAGGSDG